MLFLKSANVLFNNIIIAIIMRLDIRKPTIMSHLANCFLLAQLIATLIHYTHACTVALIGKADWSSDWSAFLQLVLPTACKVTTENGTHGRHVGGMVLIFTPVLVRRLLRTSSLVWAYD